MAIVFEYLYRDGGNFKNWGEERFKNEQGLSLEEIDARIREGLIDGMYFSAEKVGLPTLYFDEHNEQLDCSGQQNPDKVLDSFSAFAGGKPLLYACGLTQL